MMRHPENESPSTNLVRVLSFAYELDPGAEDGVCFNTEITSESLTRDNSAISFEVDSRDFEIQNRGGMLVVIEFTEVSLGDEGRVLEDGEVKLLSNKVLGIINKEVAG